MVTDSRKWYLTLACVTHNPRKKEVYVLKPGAVLIPSSELRFSKRLLNKRRVASVPINGLITL